MTTLEILRKGREIIGNRERWTVSHLFAKTVVDHTFGMTKVVACDISEAEKFCTMGCLFRAGALNTRGFYDLAERRATASAEFQAIEELCKTLGVPRRDLPYWNDTNDHKDVVDLFDRTIARLEANARKDTVELKVERS